MIKHRDSYGTSLGRIAFGASYTPLFGYHPSGQEIDAMWDNFAQGTRDAWENVANAVIQSYEAAKL